MSSSYPDEIYQNFYQAKKSQNKNVNLESSMIDDNFNNKSIFAKINLTP